MTGTVVPDCELFVEVETCLDDADLLLLSSNVAAMVEARRLALAADEVLGRAAVQADSRCVALHRRWDRFTDTWEIACRAQQVRSELAALLAPDMKEAAAATMWSVYGVEVTPLGGVALRAFAASPRWPQRWGSLIGRATCLWGPDWLVPELARRGHVSVSDAVPLPATQAEAVVAADLWEPYERASVFLDIRDALCAARALLR